MNCAIRVDRTTYSYDDREWCDVIIEGSRDQTALAKRFLMGRICDLIQLYQKKRHDAPSSPTPAASRRRRDEAEASTDDDEGVYMLDDDDIE